MAESPFIANLAEFFTLRDAEKTVDRVGDAARRQVHEALLLGRQKATCAETLWANGHTAEGLALAVGALEATLAAAPALGGRVEAKADAKADAEAEAKVDADAKADADADADAKAEADAKAKAEAKAKVEAEAATTASADWEPVLADRGVSKADLESIRSARTRAQEKLPPLDRDVSPAHAELFVALVRGRHRADRALAPGAMTHRDLRWARALRIGAAVVLGVAALIGLRLVTRTPTGTFATASDFYQQNPQFAPEGVIDGSAATYWLLPDGATGWLEVQTSPPRHVGRVRVLNTTNPPWADRGTQDYRIEVYAHGELERTIDGRFEWADTPAMVDHEVDLDGVERVRFVVRNHHRVGGGLAELQLD